jgi:hypothetical protein
MRFFVFRWHLWAQLPFFSVWVSRCGWFFRSVLSALPNVLTFSLALHHLHKLKVTFSSKFFIALFHFLLNSFQLLWMGFSQYLQLFGQGNCLQSQNLVLFLYSSLFFIAVHSQFEVFACQLHYFTLWFSQAFKSTSIFFWTVLSSCIMLVQNGLKFFFK